MGDEDGNRRESVSQFSMAMGAFEPENEAWECYFEQFEQYLVINNIKGEESCIVIVCGGAYCLWGAKKPITAS